MPQIAGHILIAEQVRLKMGNPPNLRDNLKPYNLGAIGPDLHLFLLDRAGTVDLLNEIVSIYRKIHEIKKTFSEVEEIILGPAEEIADWLTGGLSTQIINLVSLGIAGLTNAFAITILPGCSAQVPNPFAGLNVPGVPNGENIYVQSSDLSNIIRFFGHPYSSDPPYKTAEAVGDYANWWWVDLLHYRRTGYFAKALLDNAPDPVTSAYATGYMTHVAGDVCGHPFVNGVVGGPFRLHSLRHMVIENIIDSWIWHNYTNSDLTHAKLHEAIDVGHNLVPIVRHLMQTMRTIYVDRGIAPRLFSNSVPSEDDMKRAYQLLLTITELSTDLKMKRPTPPPTSPSEIIQEIMQHIGFSWTQIGERFDGDNEWWEWLLAPFVAGLWALVFLWEIFTLPAAIITRMSVSDLRWWIYLIQLALFELISDIRWQLVLGGWGKASSDDLTRAFATLCFQVPTERTGLHGFTCYPQKAVDHSIQGFWLADPGFSPATVERIEPVSRGTECCPYSKLPPFPDTFISLYPYDAAQDALLKQFVSPNNTILSTVDLERKTCQSTQLGNAADFAIKMLNNSYPTGSFDLDADLGYGFQSWECSPPKYRSDLSKP